MKLDLQRRPDWQIRFNDYIAKTQQRKFRMGGFDCCLWVAGGVRAMTGVDAMAEFRKKYSSVAGARAALKKYGKGTLWHTLRSKFGEGIPASRARRGDIAYMPAEKIAGVNIGTRLGFIIGAEAIFLTDGGYHRVPIALVKKAFRIPF